MPKIHYSGSIETHRSLADSFAYIANFSNVEEWDPAVAYARATTNIAPGIGCEYEVVMKSGISLNYRTVKFEAGKCIGMEVTSRFFLASEEISFTGSDKGSTVRYTADFDFPASLSLIFKFYPRVIEQIGDNALAGLKAALADSFDPPVESPFITAGDRLVWPGLWRFTKFGYRRSRHYWNPLSSSLKGRRALITGATSGIGLAAATELAQLGATVTIVARDQLKALAAVSVIKEQTGNLAISAELADMSLITEVHGLADRLISRKEPIDILINNAGALFNPRQVTAEGNEKSFALLLLAPVILTKRLHPLLVRSGSARIINVLSGGMYTQKVHPADLQSRQGRYSGSVAYARAKRGLMIVTEEWARNWRDDGIAVNAMHPGWADTPGVERALPAFYRVTRKILRTPREAADTVVWLAAATEAGGVSGKFWLDRQPHPSHVFFWTRETPAERSQLLSELDGYLECSQKTAMNAKKIA